MTQELKSNSKPIINDTLMHCPGTLAAWPWMARSVFMGSICQPCGAVLVYMGPVWLLGALIRIGAGLLPSPPLPPPTPTPYT